MYTIGLVVNKINSKMHNIEDIKAEEQRRITSREIEKIISKKYRVKKIIADNKIIENLLKSKVNFVFNLSTGVKGESRQSQVPAILEMLGIPYVGSGVLAHGMALNKAVAKKLFRFHSVSTPYFQEFYTGKEKLDPNLKFPAIVKPACEGSGFGIHKDSLVYKEEDLYQKVVRLLKDYQPPALAEEYIDGREFTVGIIGNGKEKIVLPILEIDFRSVSEEYDKFNTFESKNGLGGQKQFYCPAPLSKEKKEIIEKSALFAFDALGCKDFARVDIRMKDNVPYVIEINSLPGLQRGYSDFPRMAEVAGMSYEELILTILSQAIKIYENNTVVNETEIA
ncbi:MAG: D-alanine--D-alanine ligase family protein [Tepidanaerobacteraceae bacterium]